MPTPLKTPHLLGVITLTPGERAALMTEGGTTRRITSDDGSETYRFVVTGYTPGHLPRIMIERESKHKSALGELQWNPAEALPSQIVTALITRLLWPFLGTDAPRPAPPLADTFLVEGSSGPGWNVCDTCGGVDGSHNVGFPCNS